MTVLAIGRHISSLCVEVGGVSPRFGSTLKTLTSLIAEGGLVKIPVMKIGSGNISTGVDNAIFYKNP